MFDFLHQALGNSNNRITSNCRYISNSKEGINSTEAKTAGKPKQQDANSGDRKERWNTKKSLISELGTAWAVGRC
jgi:hypothetical protein